MKYFIVTQEWSYPTESGRDLVGDFDTLEQALQTASSLYLEEKNNFLEVSKKICKNISGHIIEDCYTEGYVYNSSEFPEKEPNFFYRVIVISRDV